MVRMMADKGVNHARLNLKPAELGGIEVRLRSTGDGVHALLVADSPEAARMLAGAGDDLRRQLEDKNVNLLSLDVSTSDKREDQPAGFNADGFGADDYRPGRSNMSRSSGNESALLMEAPASADTVLVLPDGVHVDAPAYPSHWTPPFMAVDPISGKTLPETTKAGAQSGSTSASNPSAALDKDGFLKLFVAQLQHQDPTSPMDTNDSMQQMSSFSMVEQITNMASTNTKIAASLNTSSAVGLIGRTVTYIDSSDQLKTGKVEKVATSKDGVSTITVAGLAGVDPSTIIEVA